ncbi:MAG: radical SAM protein [Nanoarchaeota archaeon]|nr:radical SAM protein [Nanoarchaeota archaeon]
MKALTYTIIAGNRACPNDCPICISKMTPDYGMGYERPVVNWKRFQEATVIAQNHGAENVLFTGKGEPTLYPGQITQYLLRLYQKSFDRRELQTDGSLLAKGGMYNDFLDVWADLGLNTVAVSIYHYDPEVNKQLFRRNEYFDLPKLLEKVHQRDLNTRLSCVMLQGHMDNVPAVENLIQFAKKNGVFQLTLRRADRPRKTLDRVVADFVDQNRTTDEQHAEITDFITKQGSFCYDLPHGASVYEVDGQNVCIATGLTAAERYQEEIRQLIFFPQGWLTTSWENVQGGRLL